MSVVSPETYPKNMISEALLMAQKAVALDSANDVPKALLAYTNACEMLSLVLSSDEIRADRQKLSQIHSTYIERIYLLNKLQTPSATEVRQGICNPDSESTGINSYLPINDLPPSSPMNASQISEGAPIYHDEKWQRISPLGHDNTNVVHRDIRDRSRSEISQIRPSSPLTHTLHIDRAATPDDAIENADLSMCDHNDAAAESDEDNSFLESITMPHSSTKVHRVVSFSEENATQLSPKCDSPTEDVASEPRDFFLSRTFMKSASAVAASYRRPSLNMQNLARARSNTSTKADRLSIERGYPRSRSSSLVPSATRRSIYHSFDFRQRKFEDDVSDPPGEILLRPYWLMKILQKTLTRSDAIESGTFLSRELFIPGDTWLASNCKIRAVDEKMKCYQLIIESLQNIIACSTGDVVSLLQTLDGFTRAMNVAHSLLAKKLGIEQLTCANLPPQPIGEPITTTRTRVSGKSINRLLGRKASRETLAASSEIFEGPHAVVQYALSQVFEMSQIMVDIYERLMSENLPIKEQVRVDQVYLHAAYFFGRVIVKIYLADLMRLMLSRTAEDRD